MKAPKIQPVKQENINTCASVLILAMLAIKAGKFEIKVPGFAKDGYTFGDFKVTVEKISYGKKI